MMYEQSSRVLIYTNIDDSDSREGFIDGMVVRCGVEGIKVTLLEDWDQLDDVIVRGAEVFVPWHTVRFVHTGER